ncbi:MAG: bactofilin family protein [Dehalococcoidia bacterium]
MTMVSGAGESLARSNTRQSFIDRDSHFNGTYTTPNDLHVEGRYEGEIQCEGTLVVAESADVNARIVAGNITVAGRLQGEIGCRSRFEILPTGRVGARVLAGTIVVHEGARYEGELRMRGEETAEPAARAGSLRPAAAASPARRRSGPFEGTDVPAFPPTTPPSSPPVAPRSNGRAQAEEGTAQAPADRTVP